MLNNELLLRMLTGNLIARAKYSRFAAVEEENRREWEEQSQDKKRKVRPSYIILYDFIHQPFTKTGEKESKPVACTLDIALITANYTSDKGSEKLNRDKSKSKLPVLSSCYKAVCLSKSSYWRSIFKALKIKVSQS